MNRTETVKKPTFDPETSFFDLPIVRKTAYIFVSIFVLSCVFLVFSSNLLGKWDPTYKGFNNALVIFKTPLSFLALIIPIGAVFAANHRSEQTKHQIALSHKQNLFVNYYKHIEEFEKFTDQKLKEYKSSTVYFNQPIITDTNFNTRHLHTILFPRLLETGKLEASDQLIYDIEKICFGVLNSSRNHRAISELKVKSMAATDAIRELEHSYGFSFGKLFSEDLNSKREKIDYFVAEYANYCERFNEQDKITRIYLVSDCYIILDAMERLQTALKFIQEIMKFDTLYGISNIHSALANSAIAVTLLDENDLPVKRAKDILSRVPACSDLPSVQSIVKSEIPVANLERYVLDRAELFTEYTKDLDSFYH
ncbi:hypothetical protein [Vibrio coralliilyticus]|uniref:hypothetical protein n=1 Tax=Vibrio coralliilyticus TaxID=190893 RepID=UPI002FD26CE4